MIHDDKQTGYHAEGIWTLIYEYDGIGRQSLQMLCVIEEQTHGNMRTSTSASPTKGKKAEQETTLLRD